MPVITDLLLDSQIAAEEALRDPGQSDQSISDCASRLGIRVWCYAGHVESIHAMVAKRLHDVKASQEADPAINQHASAVFSAYAQQVQWLAATAGDCQAFASKDPAIEQMVRALARLGTGARLVTERTALLDQCPQALRPADLAQHCVQPVPMAFIDLARQQDRVRGPIEDRIHRVMRHGQYIMGPEIAELEGVLATYVGVKHAITVASGTDSLEIALRALGIGPGDEVITTPFTWISSAEVIALVGATPVFVDIDPQTFNIDHTLIEAAITPRTKALMPVSLFGQMPDIEAINAIAARHHLPVIEDAAQSFGATRHGRRSGGVTTIGSTSFFPAKPLGCYGDGGALFTNDDALGARMRAIRTHGGEKRHHHPYVGMNGRFDTMQAAVVLGKWEQWSFEVSARERIGARYSQCLGNTVATPMVSSGNTHVFAQYTIRSAQRDRLAEALKAKGIPTSVFYPIPMHRQVVFQPLGKNEGAFPVAEQACREVLSLPMYPDMTDEIQNHIVTSVLSAVSGDGLS